jgi:hypothetical protein
VFEKIGEPSLPALTVGLNHWRDCGRVFSTMTLMALREKSALPALVRRLNDDQRYVAQAAAEAILLIVPVDAPEAGAARAKLGTK